MKSRLDDYGFELAIVLLGLTATAVESIATARTDIALIVGLTSFLLALSVAAIKRELRRNLGQALHERRILEGIANRSWRTEAQAAFERVRLEHEEWTHGIRHVATGSSLTHQTAGIARAQKSICAIHVAMSEDAINRLANPQAGFNTLLDAYRRLPSSLSKRRILVLDSDDASICSGRTDLQIVSKVITQVCATQMTAQAEGGLGFDLRVLWRRPSDLRPRDTLIVDGEEVYAIETVDGQRFTKLEICLNPALVQRTVDEFEDWWATAGPPSLYANSL